MTRPDFVTQRDGSPLANSNCRMASICMGLQYDSGKTSTGAKMRSYTSDQSGGTDAGDAREAWDNGYGEVLTIEDGGTFEDALDALREGRMVHLDVWHAAVGGPCLSGSGGYGHTIAIVPEHNDSGWVVGDPWCTDGYHRVTESRLRAGAEEWGRRVYGAAREEDDWPTGGFDPRSATVRAIVHRVVARLMSRSFPGHERTIIAYEDTGGAQPILFTVTRAVGATDMAISTRGLVLTTQHAVTLPEGTNVYEAPQSGAAKIGDYSGAHDFFGYSGDYKAVRVSGPNGSVIGYTNTGASVYEKEPQDNGNEARDAEWREWLLEGSPGS